MSLRRDLLELELFHLPVVGQLPYFESLVVARAAQSDLFGIVDDLAVNEESFDARRVSVSGAVRNLV